MNRQAAFSVLLVAMLLCALVQHSSPASEPEKISPTANMLPYLSQVQESTEAFATNAGQLDNTDVLFYLSSGSLALTRDSAVIYCQDDDGARGLAITLTFIGANEVVPVGRVPTPWPSNYFTGNDPELWRTGIANHREVFYQNLWDGIDLCYYMGAAGLKYDLILHPGSDHSRIMFGVAGHEELRITEAGDLEMLTGLGHGTEILDSRPNVFYADNVKEGIDAKFILSGPDTYSFELLNPDTSRPIIIDPLIFSTFLGGGDSDAGGAIAVDADGHAYVTGETCSGKFPTTAGTFDIELNGISDVFVTKLSPSGDHIIYSTFLGGAGHDVGHAIAVDDAGCAHITGETFSTGFPTTSGAFDRTYNGVGDAFVAKLGPNGDTLEYSTFLGGKHDDVGSGIALDGDGHAYVTGHTWSGSFPITSAAYSALHSGDSDVFVSKLGPNGDILLYSTFVGGSGSDIGRAVDVDAGGLAYVAGSTRSGNFPLTPGTFNVTSNGTDIFVFKMAKSGSSVIYSTRFGGSGDDNAMAICVDAAGRAHIAGDTGSTDLPTTIAAMDDSHNGGTDAFIAKLDDSGSSLDYCTYLGGSHDDVGSGIALDSMGSAHITGFTWSPDLPTTPDAVDRTMNGNADAFMAKMSPAGNALIYSTYLGGSLGDHGRSIALDAQDSVFVAGETSSINFPITASAMEVTHSGGSDVFIAKFDITIPFASAGPDRVVNESTPVKFDGTASTDNMGIANYTWSFNDGVDDMVLSGPTPTHVFKIPGIYSIKLNVSDAVGNWNCDFMELTVLMYPLPVAVAGLDRIVNESEPILLDASDSHDNGGIASYLWRFDDGINNVTLDTPSPAWSFNVPGRFIATLEVRDSDGNLDRASINITVIDRSNPVPKPAIMASGGKPVKFDASASWDNVGIVNYSWEFIHNGSVVTLYGQSPEYMIWTPGTYAVNLTVEDASGNRASNIVALAVEDVDNNGGIQWGYYALSLIVSAIILLLAVWLRKRRAPEQPRREEPEKKEAKQ